MQHTPKPEAQVPSFVPPFVEHSSLKFNKKFTFKNYICPNLVFNFYSSGLHEVRGQKNMPMLNLNKFWTKSVKQIFL